jgi:hypothetical protein
MKSGNLNFLEPSGPLQACNGTALPLLVLTNNCMTFAVVVNYMHVSKQPANVEIKQINTKRRFLKPVLLS